MRPYPKGHGERRKLVAALVVVVALGLSVEALVALVFSHEEVFDVPAAITAPVFAAAQSAPEQAPAAALPTPRPRIHLELPRLAGWPAPPTPDPPAAKAAPLAAGQGRVSAEFIERYLVKKNSSMIGMGRVFWEYGRQYNVDPRLLVAISGNETGFGRILTSRYNAFNWFYQGTWDSHFASWEEAIEVVTRGVREHYLDEGRTNVASLGEKYGPIGAANDPLNLNVNFVPNVTRFLEEMGGDPEQLTFD